VSLIVVGSQKGSPGASLTALTLAAAWPRRNSRQVVLLEADPDGGVLAVRYGLGREPGLLTLAASSRHGVNRDELDNHAQAIPGGLSVVVAPDRPAQVAAALHTGSTSLGTWMQGLTDVDVIADVGRLTAHSPAAGLTAAADMVMMVARPNAEQIQPAAERLKAIRRVNDTAGWCLIGTKPHTPDEITKVHGVPVFGIIADDRKGAHWLEQGGSPARVRRSALVRSAASLAESLDGWLHPRVDPAAPVSRSADEDDFWHAETPLSRARLDEIERSTP